MNTIRSWGRAVRSVVLRCGCGPGAEDGDEPVYEVLGHQHQADNRDSGDSDDSMRELVDEIRWMLAPVVDLQESMRRLELCLHPLLVTLEDEENHYVDMQDGLRRAPATPRPEPPTPGIWLAWLQERVDYGEPW